MKKILFAIAAIACVACSQKPSATTVLQGEFAGENAPETVRIVLPNATEPVEVAIVDGKFSYEMPTTLFPMAMIQVNGLYEQFIADGTPLTVSIDDDKLKVTSANPEISAQENLNALNAWNKDFMERYSAAAPEARDEMENEYYAHFKEVFNQNTNNAIAIICLSQVVEEVEVAEAKAMIAKLSDDLKADKSVQSTLADLDVKEATGEGKMFTDFEINQTYDIHEGYTGGRVKPNLPVKETVEMPTVKFSDYVGKGKYMLVDFWASWCGPCKREIPYIKAAYDKFHGDQFDVLSVGVWDEPQATIDTAKVYGLNWNHIINAKNIPTDIYGIKGIPHLIFFGPDGTILKRGLRGEGIEEELAKYIK